ncbi:ABC transporter permease subunit [Pseudoflavitalea rhizosphaerae]|uniref:ABC transporter permease subunit n=1 Tax=Pseudoflavitalea rhizosphaerae TaxID=1884793 RepID=UPI000F8EB533|nr:Gldg family protein [Pseudoflavitalea rhizosphaerae]
MKLLLKITKNELRNLFYSPVAWILTLLFLVLCSYTYTSIVYVWAKQTELISGFDAYIKLKATASTTFAVFNDPSGGLFFQILPHIYLFIPLLTMSIISREINNGTIRLLYSSPVTLRQIVLGKYLALMIYNLVFMCMPAIFVVSGYFDIPHLDYGPLLSALLGMYLLLCALTAIGFFMSGLTTYPIVAAVASFTVLLVLVYIGGLWQQYDFVRDITYFLSLNNRVNKMIAGLITSKDLIYYLVIIFMFVSFTILKLKDGRDPKPWSIKAGRYLAVIVIGLTAGYISSRPRLIAYWDTSNLNVNTAHPVTQKMLKKLDDGPLEVTLYVNLLHPSFEYGLPGRRNAYMNEVWEKYQRFKRDIQYKYVYFYDLSPANDSSIFKFYRGKSLKQIAGVIAKKAQVDSSMFMGPEEIRKIIDLSDENNKMIMELRYKNRKTFLRTSFTAGTSGGIWPGEMLVNAAFKRLTGEPVPKIYFLSGELERSIYKKGEREYDTHTANRNSSDALVNLGFDADTLNLQTQPIPGNATTLVLADPRMELSPAAQQKLEHYIGEGRNMLILGEPGKQHVLNPILKKTGVRFIEGQLVESRQDETAEKITYHGTPASFELAREWWLIFFKHLSSHKVPNLMANAWLAGGAAPAYTQDSGFTVKPLIITGGKDVWVKKGKLVTDSVPPVFEPFQGDIKQSSFPIFLQLTRNINNREQRIIVGGDADFASNHRIVLDNMRSFYSWLNYNEAPYYTPIPYAKDNFMSLGSKRAAVYNIVYVWVLPTILLLTGMIILTRRKRK